MFLPLLFISIHLLPIIFMTTILSSVLSYFVTDIESNTRLAFTDNDTKCNEKQQLLKAFKMSVLMLSLLESYVNFFHFTLTTIL